MLSKVLPESNFLQVEGVLNDACGGHSDPQNVLLCGDVAWRSHPVNV